MWDSPLEIHRGDVEDDSFEPQDHEEPLGEGAVPDALSITSRLEQTRRTASENVSRLTTTLQVPFLKNPYTNNASPFCPMCGN